MRRSVRSCWSTRLRQQGHVFHRVWWWGVLVHILVRVSYRVRPGRYDQCMESAVEVADTVQEFLTFLESVSPAGSEAANIDVLQQLEQAKRALAAVQAEVTNSFVQQRQAAEAANRIPTSQQLKGIEAEVGLARGESAFVGAALTHTATALCTVLPNTLAALAAGRVSEYHARIVAEQTNHLSEAHRREIDAAIAHRLGKASSSQLRTLLQGHAYRLDRAAAEQRAANNKRRRCVGLVPLGDGMVAVNAELPAHQGLAVMDALNKRTNQRLAAQRRQQADGTPGNAETGKTAGETLSRSQVMADVFVETLTGQTTATGVDAEVIVVVDDATLFGDGDTPGWIPGHGPLPAGMVKAWLADPEAKTFIRRMYTRPSDGQLVALESNRRRFPDGLVEMLRLRDDVCDTLWCTRLMSEADHRRPWAQGGATSWANGTGLCTRCNQRKENRGWTYTGTPDQLVVTTPTGHSYTVGTTPPISQLRQAGTDPPRVVIDIAWCTAA